MSFTLHGLAVSGGIAIGHAHLISHAVLEVTRYQLRERDVADELKRLDAALATARDELDALREEANNAGSPGELSAFIDLHSMLLADQDLTAGVHSLIRDGRCNAEWAMVQQMHEVAAQFDAFEDAYLRERKHDVSQVVERVLRGLFCNMRNTRSSTMCHKWLSVCCAYCKTNRARLPAAARWRMPS